MLDVIIVGAGPAGTAAAYDLLEAGYRVRIIDKTGFPRKKACAGGLTPKTVRGIRYDISPVVKKRCRHVKVTRPSGGAFLTGKDRELCCMVRREELDDFSLKRVLKRGASFCAVKKISAIEKVAAGVKIVSDGKIMQAKYLIGADGADSTVRRLTSRFKNFSGYYAVAAEVEISNSDDFHMEFDFNADGSGYKWIFPKDDHLNIGVAVLGHGLCKSEMFYRWAWQKVGIKRFNYIRGGRLSTGGWRYRPDSNTIFLVGDAAGLTEPLLGEGIYNAVKSGQAAAKAIAEGKRLGMPEGALYSRYISDIKKDLNLYKTAAKVFYSHPALWTKVLSFSTVNRIFENLYARGKTMNEAVEAYQPRCMLQGLFQLQQR